MAKEDISVRFYEERNGQVAWEAYGDFQHTNVHKQVAIAFRTPRYSTIEVDHPIKVHIQLKRPSDSATSESLPFELLPLDSGRRTFWSVHRELKKRAANTDLFQQILDDEKDENNDQRDLEQNNICNFNNMNNYNCTSNEVVVLDTPVEESKVFSEQPLGIDKANDWLQNVEFITDDNNNHNQNPTDDEKTLNELLEQVAELDEIYTDHQLRRENMELENELHNMEQNLPKEEVMDVDEPFDDAATYTSLQRAFKNPMLMTEGPPIPPRMGNTYELVEPPPIIVNPPGPIIDFSLKRENHQDEKLPPLPPKRAKKLPDAEISNGDKENKVEEISVLNVGRRNSAKSLTARPQTEIIIMKSTEQIHPSKKLPPTPKKTSTLPKPKKSGFFSRMFSKKKGSADISVSVQDITKELETGETEFTSHFDTNDPNRDSFRSTRSLKPNQTPNTNKKTGKPVGRSVSSASGKRPNITADVVHIPLKGDSNNSLPFRSGSATHLSLPGNDSYERASTASLHPIDRRTMSALQLADVPIQDGDMELIAIADAQSLKNLCEGEYGIRLDPGVDLTEAEHYALYTTLAPHATQSEFDEASCYYSPVECGEILTPAEVARRLQQTL